MKEIDKTTDSSIEKNVVKKLEDVIHPPYYLDNYNRIKKGVIRQKSIFDVFRRRIVGFEPVEYIKFGKSHVFVKSYIKDEHVADVKVEGYGGRYEKTIWVSDPALYLTLKQFGEAEGFDELSKLWVF